MQENGYLLPAKEAPNHSLPRSGDGRGNGEKAKRFNRVRLNGNIARRNIDELRQDGDEKDECLWVRQLQCQPRGVYRPRRAAAHGRF